MARGVNKVILIGNLGKDPDVRYTPNGNAVTNLNLATDESYKDKNTGQLVPKTEWHRIVIFGKIAEVAGQYLRKGSKIYIEGKLQTRKWQNKEGQDIYTTEVVLDINGQMQMLDSKGGDQGSADNHQQGGGQNNGYQQNAPQQQRAPAQQGNGGNGYAQPQGGAPSQQQGNQQQNAPLPDPVDDFDDDIPF